MAKSRKKYYAIKEGKDCKDKIVNTWDECKKFTHGYNAVYKGFQTLEEAEEYLGKIKEKDIEKIREQKKFSMDKKKKEKAKGTHIGLRVPKEIYEELEKRSKTTGLKIEDLVKFALNQYLF